MPHIENWREIAVSIAHAFNTAMARTNGGKTFGLSTNQGPVPRFVAAVVPLITGEKPEVGNVGKHLKDEMKLLKKRGCRGTGTMQE